MSTFNFHIGTDAQKTITPNIRTAQFGDGYSQRVPNGINNQPDNWNITVTGRQDYIQEIEDFFVALNGDSFDWTDPQGNMGKYRIDAWAKSFPGLAAQTISTTFIRVYGE